ncbi:alcohol dehydrogenase catalytic domain-containing protein [Saccharopolyspora sp. 5N102]|uniref:alcohol dehydrogenase catalytic domain-containing protein n=1 Tax=Saccharopolyspora sp. 5N102 TaxID=3375155 RepID=UPI00379D996A
MGIAEVAVPEAGPRQVLIRVAAATVNPVDLATRTGALTDAGLLPAREVSGSAGMPPESSRPPATRSEWRQGDDVLWRFFREGATALSI